MWHENRDIDAQCSFLDDLFSDWRLNDRDKLDLIPAADYRKFHRLWDRAFNGAAIGTKNRDWLDAFEKKVVRVRDGKSYEPSPDPAKQENFLEVVPEWN